VTTIRTGLTATIRPKTNQLFGPLIGLNIWKAYS